MRLVAATIAFLGMAVTSPVLAQDSSHCVQQMLVDAGYEIGAVDGVIGGKTRDAAAALSKAYPALGLPALKADTLGTWCEAANGDAFRQVIADRAALALVAWRDLPGPTKRWAAHKGGSVCYNDALARGAKFNTVPVGALPKFDPAIIKVVHPIFPPAPGAPACTGNKPMTRYVPPPIVDAAVTGNYFAADWAKFTPAATFLGPAIARYRGDPSAETGASLKKFLVEWATADAISVNIRAPWGAVDYGVMKLVPAMIVGYSEVAALMTDEESEVVARWLHRIVKQVLASEWDDRQDNKAYMRNNVAFLWGLLTENQALKQYAYQAFDDALYDIRPDGSAPADSMRGGSGLHYSNLVSAMLTFTALLGAADGQNLYTKQVEGRSLHNVVNWSVVASKFPELNLRYALRCPDAGDMPGEYDRKDPDLRFVRNGLFSSWAVGYLMAPDVPPETRSAVESMLPVKGMWGADIHSAGSMACYAAGLFAANDG